MQQMPVTATLTPHTPALCDAVVPMSRMEDPGKAYHRIKCFLDILVMLLLAVPLGLAILLIGLIALFDGAPIFYRLEAVGKDGKRFHVYKFCTMERNAEHHLAKESAEYALWERERKLEHDPRVLRTRRWLRQTSIDELPQIVNVLRGEMSFVGPRYVCPDELAIYGEFAQQRQTMLPGISGLWQINGRNLIPYRQRIIFDRTYYFTRTVWGDLGILLRTIPAVLRGKGAF
jgi:exopolysaccharide production protein ExoY